MTATDLVEAVANEIRDAVANLKLPLEHQSTADFKLVPVNVYEQFLPREAFNDDTYYPLVLVEWLGTNDELNGTGANSTSNIGLSMGVFAAENWGWKDALHLTEVIRHRILTRRVVGKKFRLTDDVGWEVSTEQPLPFFYTYATLSYMNFLPEENFTQIN